MKKTFTMGLTLLVILLGASGCSSRCLTDVEQGRYRAQVTAGVVVKDKNFSTAVALSFLPFGIGAGYTNNNVLQGTSQFVFWPVSIIWGPMANWGRVRQRNYDATVVFLTEERKKKLAELDPKQVDVSAKRKEIDDHYRPLIPLDPITH